MRGLGISFVLVAVCLCPARGESPTESVIEPIDIEFTEQTGRSLLFIDVEGVDQQGRPLTGLRKEDFEIRVNRIWRKIYSVDDLCLCGDAAPDPDNPTTDPAQIARLAVIQTPPHFVLYFDYSQLGAGGRVQAVEQARRWAREMMRPADRVMVVAYATDAGLRTLTDFTGNRDEVLRAIDEGAAAADMQDAIPQQQQLRRNMCADGTLSCYHTGRQEYRHARRSMETLRNFLTDLDEVPARKTVLLFHENATIFPGRVYGGAPGHDSLPSFDAVRNFGDTNLERLQRMRRDGALVPDLIELEEQLGGSATASRAVVYPIQCGSASTWTVNFGANLADQTGGSYNTGGRDLRAVLDEAGRRCPCIYRIGLELPRKKKSFVLHTKIRVAGMTLPSRYRVQYLTRADRWMRKAQLVLANPDQWRDLDLRAAVVPLQASARTWDVSVQIAFDIGSLKVSPMDDHNGEWEIAALLAHEDFRKTWEMLGVYRARRGDDGQPQGVVLHERLFEKLKPGRYELRAFVRDRAANLFGGASVEIELPAPEKGGLSGPVMLSPHESHYRSPLPVRKKRRPKALPATAREDGPLPLGNHVSVSVGQAVQFLTWDCSGGSTPRPTALLGDGESWTPRPAEIREAGTCVELSDIVDTRQLEPGHYVYEVTTGGEVAAAVFDVEPRER